MEKNNIYKRIVFITRLSAIGDVLITSNSVFCLLENGYYPVFITSPSTSEIALNIKGLETFICYSKENNPIYYLNKLEVDKTTFFTHLESIKTQYKNIYLDFQNTKRSKRVYTYLKNKINISFEKKYYIRKFTLYRFLLVLLSFFIFRQKAKEKKSYNFKIKDIQRELIKEIINKDKEVFKNTYELSPFISHNSFFPNQLNYICLFPGASSFIKSWPKENFRDLMNLIKDKTELYIVICGSKNEEYLGEYLDFPKDIRVINLVNKTNLSETLNIIAHAKYVVTNDSFAGHAADNYQIPGTILFGATSPNFGFIPSYTHINIEYLNMNCSPCSRHGKSNCRYKNLKCLNDIKSIDIYKNILNILS